MRQRGKQVGFVAATACLLTAAGMAWGQATGAATKAPAEVAGKVVAVTLYRGQAQVTRLVPVAGGPGGLELVVTGLPQYVVPDSLFAEGTADVEVRAVRYRARAVGAEPRREVRELDAKIQDTHDAMALNEQQQQVVAKRVAYLDTLDRFTAATAKDDLARGALNADQLQKLTLFSFDQRDKAAQRAVQLKKDLRQLKETMALLQRQRAELVRGSNKEVREAVLFLEKRGNGAVGVRLTYLVNHCGWSPAYNFRAADDHKTMRVEYNAVVRQMSGEDWDGVALTLSTASPALSAAGPGLAPFRVNLTRGPMVGAARFDSPVQVGKAIRGLQQARQEAVAANAASLSLGGNLRTGWAVNKPTLDYQILELTCPPDALTTLRTQAAMGEGPSLSYRIAPAVSLASRDDQQMLRIMQTDLAANFTYVASPLLTSYVYRQAELSNTSADDLLGGPVNMYLGDRFVGRTEISTVARGQSFVVGLGADPQLHATRELVERQDNVQGGNQVVAMHYRLVVENFKDQPVTVRLQDRLPMSDNHTDLRVTLGKMTDELSTDPVYLRLDRPKGILRWDIAVPAHAAGAQARMVEYRYTLEYDRNLHLNMPSASPAEQEREFEHLQLQRQYKQ